MKRLIIYALILMSCEDEFVVDDPYSELDSVSESDILVFDLDCDPDPFGRKKKDPYQIKTYGPEEPWESESHVREVKELFPAIDFPI